MFALEILHIIQAIGKVLYARGITILGTYDRWGNAESGIMYFLQPIYSPHDWICILSEILNMFGSLGNASLLLTVSIAYGFYEERMFWAFSER